MLMSSLRRTGRLFALAVAAFQLAVSAAAPMYEALATRHVASVQSVSTSDSDTGAPAHDPATCPACQTLSAFARLPDTSRILASSRGTGVPVSPTPQAVPLQFWRQGFLSRAPPDRLG